MKNLSFSIGVFAVLIFSSCAQMFNGAVLPNQCKKCEVVCNGTVSQTFEGCGSENTRLYEQAVVAAYETDKCGCEVVCETWRKDPDEEQ